MISRTSGWKISAPPPGERAQPGGAQPRSTSSIEIFSTLGEPADLDGGEGLEVGVREALLQAAQHLLVPVERRGRVEAADDVELGDARCRPCPPPPRTRRSPSPSRGARAFCAQAQNLQSSRRVGRVDVAVDVVERDVAVPPSRTWLASRPRPRKSRVWKRRTPSSKDNRSPPITFSARGASRSRENWRESPSRDRGLGHRLEGVRGFGSDVVEERGEVPVAVPAVLLLGLEPEVDDPPHGRKIHDLPATAVAHVLLPFDQPPHGTHEGRMLSVPPVREVRRRGRRQAA